MDDDIACGDVAHRAVELRSEASQGCTIADVEMVVCPRGLSREVLANDHAERAIRGWADCGRCLPAAPRETPALLIHRRRCARPRLARSKWVVTSCLRM